MGYFDLDGWGTHGDSFYVPFINGRENIKIEEAWGLVKLRCADARDVGYLDTILKDYLLKEYAARGVLVALHSLSNAGSFVTSDVMPDIFNVLSGFVGNEPFTQMYRRGMLHIAVQIFVHGDVAPTHQSGGIFYTPETLSIAHGSVINCGMMHAQEVWKAIADEIISEGKAGRGISTTYFDKDKKTDVPVRIDTPEALLALLRNVYQFKGTDVYSFVSSIEDLIQHPLTQKAILREKLNTLSKFANVPIHINSALVNYKTGFCARLDQNQHVYTFLDDLNSLRAYLLSRHDFLPIDDGERVLRVSVQKDTVKAGLICPGGIDSPRTLLAEYLTASGTNVDVAGGIFGIIGNSVVEQTSPFAPYKIVAFAYSLASLKLKQYFVVGNTQEQLDMIAFKLEKDPIMKYLIEKYGVDVSPLLSSEMRQRVQSAQTNGGAPSNRSRYETLVYKAVHEWKKPQQSVLHRPIINNRLVRKA